MFEMRDSPHEQKRLLHDLFPVEATQVTDAGLMISQSLPSLDVPPATDEQPTSHLAHEAISVSGLGSQPHSIGDRSSLRLRQEGGSLPAPQPRSRLGVIGMAMVVVLGIGAGAVVLRRPKATTGTAGTASMDETGRLTKTAPAIVRVSIDSSAARRARHPRRHVGGAGPDALHDQSAADRGRSSRCASRRPASSP